MKTGFTGTQEGMTINQARMLWIRIRDDEEFHHGCCIGADEAAHFIAKSLGIRVVGHPPTNERKMSNASRDSCDEIRPALDYLDRNKEIVNETDRLEACPKSTFEEWRSGTWSTIRWGRKMRKQVQIIAP